MKSQYLSRRSISTEPIKAAQTNAPAIHSVGTRGLQRAVTSPGQASAAEMLALQRAYGNRAVGQAIQRAPMSSHGGAVDGPLQNEIAHARGGGQPLDAHANAQIGTALGANFSHVKVHTDNQSDQLNRALSAKAFTFGRDIFFSKGNYKPDTSSGKRLLAHELTHVLQQGSAKSNKLQTKLAPEPGSHAGPAEPQPNQSRMAGDAQPTIQRTVWRYRSSAWVSEKTSSSDTDTFDDPDTHCLTEGITPKDHDKYDQNTGKYYSWGEARERTQGRATSKKRPQNYGDFFDEGRETTPYGYFKPRDAGEKRSKPQGPHLLAHVTKRTVFDMAQNMGLDPHSILGSKLAPNPRQAYQMMQDQLNARGLNPKPGALYMWYKEYKTAYNKGLAKKPGWKKGVKQAMELHPLTTYRVGQVASKAELAGKDERGSVAIDDIDMLIDHPRTGGLPGSMTTVDTGFGGEGWGGGDKMREDFIFNYALAATGRPPSPSRHAEAPSSPLRDEDW